MRSPQRRILPRSRARRSLTTTSAPSSSGKARAITTSRRTSRRCSTTSKALRLLILDLGCGPGRDLKTFSDRGHRAIGLEVRPLRRDGACASGCEVWEQDFLHLDLPAAISTALRRRHVSTCRRRIAARVVRAPRHAETAPHSVRLDSARRRRGRLERRALRRVLRLGTWQRYMTSAGFIDRTLCCPTGPRANSNRGSRACGAGRDRATLASCFDAIRRPCGQGFDLAGCRSG